MALSYPGSPFAGRTRRICRPNFVKSSLLGAAGDRASQAHMKYPRHIKCRGICIALTGLVSTLNHGPPARPAGGSAWREASKVADPDVRKIFPAGCLFRLVHIGKILLTPLHVNWGRPYRGSGRRRLCPSGRGCCWGQEHPCPGRPAAPRDPAWV